MTRNMPEPESRSRELRPIYVVNFLRRNLLMIILLGVGFGGIYWLFAHATAKPQYRSSSSLIITPSTDLSSFRQAPLSVAAYKQMLGSGALIAETKRRLVAEGLLEPADSLRLGQELRSRIFLANTNKGRATPGVPLLELISINKSPAAAARAANIWGEVFLEQNRSMVVDSTTEAIEVFERLYPEAQEKLQSLELQEVQQAAERGATLRQLQDAAGAKATAHEQETLRLVNEYESQSRQLLLEQKMGQLRPQQEARLAALEEAYQKLQQDLAKIDDSLATAEAERTALQKRLSKTPQLVSLQRVVPAGSQDEDHAERQTNRRRDHPGETDEDPSWMEEVLNPIYLEVDRRLASVEVKAEILKPEKDRLLARLAELNQELISVSRNLEVGTNDLEKLVQERLVGLEELKLKREEGLAALKRQEAERLSAEKRSAETASAQLKREVAFQLDSYKKLQAQVTKASLAREQLDVEDVRLSTKAVEPDHPLPLNIGFKTVIAFLLGCLLGFLFSLARELLRLEEGLEAA